MEAHGKIAGGVALDREAEILPRKPNRKLHRPGKAKPEKPLAPGRVQYRIVLGQGGWQGLAARLACRRPILLSPAASRAGRRSPRPLEKVE